MLGLAALVAIVGNWVRVGSLIAIGHYTRMESVFVGQSKAHLFYGWAIFLVGMVVFFPGARWLGVRIARRPARDAHDRDESLPLPAERDATHTWRPAAEATLVTALGPLLYFSIGALPSHAVRSLTLISADGTWHQDAPPATRPLGWEPAFVGASETFANGWTDGADSVLVDHLLYRTQTQGAELIGYTSRIAADSMVAAERLVEPPGAGGRLVNEVILTDGREHRLVWYWYRVGGIEAVQPIRAKLLETLAFVRRRSLSELVAVSAACAPESCIHASAVLSAFLASADP